MEKSYKTFRHPDITPLKKLDEKTYILELFHGPTFAFKDVALQLLGNLFEFFLVRRNARQLGEEEQEKLTVVGATSGDTGRHVHQTPSYYEDHLIPHMQRCNIRIAEQSRHLDIHTPS